MFVPKEKTQRPSQSQSAQQKSENAKAADASSKETTPDQSIVFDTPEDEEVFALYTDELSTLAGMYLEPRFWTVVIPEKAREHSAVRHALLAFATVYQSLFFNDRSGHEQRVVNHYNTAIRSLTQGQPPIDVVLTINILFESLDHTHFTHCQAAYQHLKAAFNILREFRLTPGHEQSKHYDVVTKEIEPVIRQAQDMVDVWAHHDDFPIAAPSHKALHASTPTAQMIVWDLQCLIQTLVRLLRAPPTSDELRIQTNRHLASGRMQLQCNMHKFANLAAEDDIAALPRGKLYVSHHAAILTLIRELQQYISIPDKTHQDGIITSYRFMVDRVEEYLSSTSSKSPAQRPSSSAWDQLGVIGPLFLTIIRSPDEDLADRALKMLRSVDRIEGIWSSGLAANIAEALAQGEVQDTLGLCLASLKLERRANSIHIFDTSREFVFDHYLPVAPLELDSLNLVS